MEYNPDERRDEAIPNEAIHDEVMLDEVRADEAIPGEGRPDEANHWLSDCEEDVPGEDNEDDEANHGLSDCEEERETVYEDDCIVQDDYDLGFDEEFFDDFVAQFGFNAKETKDVTDTDSGDENGLIRGFPILSQLMMKTNMKM